VLPGDNLWKIALKTYGDGMMWKQIVRENGLVDEDQIEVGSRLTLPLVIEDSEMIEKSKDIVSLDERERIIAEDSYQVQPGDSLWRIAVRAYGDGYKWMSIFKANPNLIRNPDLLYVGWTIIIPR
jgi:nucleoid-associated protein YgaU